MTATPDLIDGLVAQATPVRRAPPPVLRATAWLGLAGIVVTALVCCLGARPDLAARLHDAGFCTGLAAAVLTAALAAFVAFTVSLPDRSRLWLLLPLPAAAVWLGSVGYGCLAHWVAFDAGTLNRSEALRCFATLLLAGAPLSAITFWMLRRTARLRPTAAVFAAAAAVAAGTAAALSLTHAFDASVVILAWNFGAAALVVAVDAAIGRRLLRPA